MSSWCLPTEEFTSIVISYLLGSFIPSYNYGTEPEYAAVCRDRQMTVERHAFFRLKLHMA
jgi:hypothetical protein